MVKVLIDDAFMEEFNKAFDSKLGDSNYNVMFDTNQDGTIDILDALWFSKYKGQEVELPWVSPTESAPILMSTADVSSPETIELLRGLHEILRTLKKSEMEYAAQLLAPLNTIAALLRSGVGVGGVQVVPTSQVITIANFDAGMDMYYALFVFLNGGHVIIPSEGEIQA